MFRQYQALKQAHPRAILFFRMGDFYEMFFEDAKLASSVLDLTLTARGKGTDNVVPMCGFPHHQLEGYTARLVRDGHRVAICDQVEDPKQAKGLVRREVVRIVTPGTLADPDQLEAKANAWVAAVSLVGRHPSAAFLDASTGEFLVWEADEPDEAGWTGLADRLRAFAPREVVHAEELAWPERFCDDHLQGALLTPVDAYAFSPTAAEPLLERQLGVATLDGFGLRRRPAALSAAGGLLHYLQDTQRSGLEHINSIRVHEPSRFLLLDPATRRNLELERSLRDGGRKGSFIHAVDETVTSAGGRLLRSWLLAPLLDPVEIGRRQDAIDEFLRRMESRRSLRERLRGVQDVERLLSRVVARTASPRDLLGLRSSLERLPGIVEELEELRAPLVRELIDGLDPCTDVAQRLAGAIVDDPPTTLKEGGVIRDGYDTRLDEYRAIQRDGRAYIASLETKEREATGIASLKVRFNKVFGYFIEVSKPNLRLVPDHYHRKQTISTGERFVTPELKEYEAKVLHAQERIESLELELFGELRSRIASESARLQSVARATAQLDTLAGLAEVAARGDFCRPTVDEGRELRIVGGRHPVVERSLVDTRFVPNDTRLEAGARSVAVLTGPNMGGKSTYLRQVALITLLAQTGSFVPADEATIGVVDRIFCRVGASDSLAEGQSTFMVEMTETANILHHATPRSLLLLDEIGRGTSTFDGLSIAWAVVEFLTSEPSTAPRTLFATHYHELTELAVELETVLNLRMAVKEWGDSVIFTHRVEDGASDRSYGIQVARLAGVPAPVVERAAEILHNLERDEYGRDGLPRRARRGSGGGPGSTAGQGSLFSLLPGEAEAERPAPLAAEVLAELRSQDTNRITPIEALNLVASWQERLKRE
jgi:DNA mismatch repair protein MutS